MIDAGQLYSPRLTYDALRPEAKACAVAYLLRLASNRVYARRGKSWKPPRGGPAVVPSANLPIGRRVLRALQPVLDRYRMTQAERAVGRCHPRPRPHALAATIHGRRPKLSEADINRVEALRAEGSRWADIAAEFGVAQETIKRSLKRKGVPVRPWPVGRRRKLSPSDLEKARAMREEGYSYDAIGEQFGVTDRCVSMSLKRVEREEARLPATEATEAERAA